MKTTVRSRRLRALPVLGAALALLLPLGAAPALAEPGRGGPPGHPRDSAIHERQVLPAEDGWASAEGGTRGGADAAEEHVYDVSTRQELLDALADAGDAPSIVRVHGTIPMNAGADGEEITCEEIAEGTGYSLDAYLAAYDPETWGMDQEPEGEQEEARRRAAAKQRALIQVTVPSNTTIIGAEEGAGLTGAALSVSGADDVILRNLVLADTYDCFPAWDPTDGEEGAWNSEYDSVRIVDGTTHVWVDHVAFTDEPMTDDLLPTYFGQTYQRHDGALDITNGSDLVTVSWNTFRDHDKLTLVGSTDNPDRGDPGRLRVTFHHNLYEGIGQRAPRVRFGQVDVYNNSYRLGGERTVPFGYAIGVGYDSHLWVEANSFRTGGGVGAGALLTSLNGSTVHTTGNLVDHRRVDLREAFNAQADPEDRLADDTSWRPQHRACVDTVQHVDGVVGAWAGPQHGAAPGRIGADCRS